MHRTIQNIVKEGKMDNSSEKQKQEFLSLFHQPEIEIEFKNQLLDDLIEAKLSSKDKLFFDDLFEKFWRKRKIELTPKVQRNSLVIRFGQWAAILVIGLVIGYYFNSLQKVSSPVYYTSVAPKGSVSQMILPDGSHIFLNSGSEIKFTVDGIDGMREIYLTGEAWFQVAKMKEKPFLVHTSFYDVQVTGTSFNVKAYPEDKEVTTTLEEGTVFVKSSESLRLAKEAELKPGEQLVYSKESKKISIAEVNTKWYTSWKDNKLVFVNMSLKDLKTLLERKYGVEIELSDQSILNYHYDGTLKNETILEVLEILENTLPIHYQIVGQRIVISKK
jgi:ferric-dicitrate binding protein FerR (iron transport regulator)